MNAAGISPDSNGFTDSAAARILSGYADAGSIPVGMRTTLAFALEKGYFAGKTGADGRLYLHPDEDISRAEAAVLLSNIIGYARNTAVNAFADADTIPTWSVPALSSLKALGLLCSPNNTAAPAGRQPSPGARFAPHSAPGHKPKKNQQKENTSWKTGTKKK